MEFAVWYEGVAEGQGKWVLAVDRERVLVSDDEGKLLWKPLAQCRLVKIATPEMARPVIAVQQQIVQAPGGLDLKQLKLN